MQGSTAAGGRLEGSFAPLALGLLVAMAAGRPGTARAEPRIVVSVAASFRDVGATLARGFEAANPGVAIELNNGPSGMLARQIEDGAPVDVFVSAGWPEVERLRAKGLVAGPPVVVARNRLVLVVPAGSPWIGHEPRAVLAAPEVTRVASGDPQTVPFGAYAKQALEAAGLWAAVAPKLVFAAEVRQALTYADQKAVDAAIVYASDAPLAKHAVVVGEVPGASGLAIETVAVRTRHASGPLAERFLAHLRSDAARAALDAAGFLPPRTS